MRHSHFRHARSLAYWNSLLPSYQYNSQFPRTPSPEVWRAGIVSQNMIHELFLPASLLIRGKCNSNDNFCLFI